MVQRGFELIADEPESVGGTNSGSTPTELYLSSLATCFAMAVAFAARKRGIELPDLQVKATGSYDGPRFSRIDLEVRSSHPREELDALVQRAIPYCYVSNTLARPPQIEYLTFGEITHEPPPPPD